MRRQAGTTTTTIALDLFYKGTRSALRCQFSITLVNQHADKDDDRVQAPPVTFGGTPSS